MTTRATYHIRPVEDVWLIQLEGDSQTEAQEDKADAITRARQLAGRYDVGRVVVHEASGAVEQEYDVTGVGVGPSSSRRPAR